MLKNKTNHSMFFEAMLMHIIISYGSPVELYILGTGIDGDMVCCPGWRGQDPPAF